MHRRIIASIIGNSLLDFAALRYRRVRVREAMAYLRSRAKTSQFRIVNKKNTRLNLITLKCLRDYFRLFYLCDSN